MDDNDSIFGKNENFKIIPKDFKANRNSPEAQELAMIYNDGNVDFFIRCGNWNINDKNGNKYLYQRITFKVDKKLYDKDYNSIEEFKNKIRGIQINQIDVAIYNPKKHSLYDDWEKKEIFKKDKIKVINDITCGEIFDAFENATYKIYTKNIYNLLASAGAHKEAVECQQSELGEKLDLIRKTGDCHIEDLNEDEKQKYHKLQKKNDKLENENQELKKKNAEYKNDQDTFNAEKNQFEKDQEKLQNEKNQFEKEKVQFQNDLEQLQKENNLNPTQNILIDIQKEKILLKSVLEELKKGREELKKGQNKLENEKVLLEKGQEKLQKEKEKFEQEKALLQQLKDPNQDILIDIKNEKILLKKNQKKLQKEKEKFEQEKVEFQKNNPNQDNLINIQNENGKLKKEIQELKKEKDLLQKKQVKFEKENIQFQNDLEELQNENNQLKIDNGLLKDEKNKLKGEKDKLKGEKEENKTKVSELFQQDYVIRKEGLFDCCCGPAYRSLEAALAAAQAEKEIAIEN